MEGIDLKPRPEQERDCLLCQDGLGDLDQTECPGCETRVHMACVHELGQATCPVPGCGQAYRLPSGEPIEVRVLARRTPEVQEGDELGVVEAETTTPGQTLAGVVGCLTFLIPPLLGVGWLWWKFFGSVRMYFP